jgi:hypothetical protein
MRLVELFMVFIVAAGAFGQSCERTLTLNMGIPSGSAPAFGVQDYEATIRHEPISVIRVEPFKRARILILLPADYNHITKDKGDFERLIGWLSGITALPRNISVAYGMYAEKMIFSDHFTSDPQELRSSLEGLAKNAKTGSLGVSDTNYDRLAQAVEYFGRPEPGNSVILLNDGMGAYQQPAITGGEVEVRFLQAGIRLFVLIPSTGLTPHTDPFFLNIAEGTGGYMTTLSNFHPAGKKDEVQTFYAEMGNLLNMSSMGYLLTVAVPQNAKQDAGSWSLTLSAAARSHLGISPKMKIMFFYPNLLLCGTSKNGAPMMAGADRQHR